MLLVLCSALTRYTNILHCFPSLKMSSPRPPEYHYSPVTNEEEKGLITESSSSPSRPQFSRLRWPLLCLLLVASSLIVGCLIGIQFSESRSLENDAPIKCTFAVELEWSGLEAYGFSLSHAVDWLSIVFQSNRTFLQRPSEESDRTWESLYPADHGFFDYPDTDPLRSTFAGFHQLHCVV